MEDGEGRDDEPWRRSLAGDGPSFGVLFDRHRGRVFRHACRVTTSRAEAEDVVAASFLELWRRRDDVRLVQGSVLPWLLVTATNIGRNVARGTRRYRALLARLPRDTDEPDVAAAVVEGVELGLDPRLRSALAQLNRADLSLFVLVAIEDFTVAEAAEALGISSSAARTRLSRARARMRQSLAGHTTEAHPIESGGPQ